VKLRERLVPYLAEEARRAVDAGEPLMRPLFFDAPDAEEAFAHPYQWMLGDELLVAPVVEEGADAVRAWLPDGEWVDAFRGTRHSGGVVERDVPLDETAVWIRASAAERLRPLFG
jgi:alpha-glucosidase (family GH31 glycosyl hydrolase)